MTSTKNIEQRVKEDLANDSPPLSQKEYVEYIKDIYHYTLHDKIAEFRLRLDDRVKHYDKRKEISEDEHRMKASKGFIITRELDEEETIYTDSIISQVFYGRTPKQKKLNSYLKENYPELLKEYKSLALKSIDFKKGSKKEFVEGYDAYATKLLLVANEYNQNAPKEDKVLII